MKEEMGQFLSTKYMTDNKSVEVDENTFKNFEGEYVSVYIRFYDMRHSYERSFVSEGKYKEKYTYSLPFIYIMRKNKDECLFTYSFADDCILYINGERKGTYKNFRPIQFEQKGVISSIRYEKKFKMIHNMNCNLSNILRYVRMISFYIGNDHYIYETYSNLYYDINSIKIFDNLRKYPELEYTHEKDDRSILDVDLDYLE